MPEDRKKPFSERGGELLGTLLRKAPGAAWGMTPMGAGQQAGELLQRGVRKGAEFAGTAIGRAEASPFGRGYTQTAPSMERLVDPLMGSIRGAGSQPEAATPDAVLPPVAGAVGAQDQAGAWKKMMTFGAMVEAKAWHPQWKKAARAQVATRLLDEGMDPFTVMVWVEGGSQGFLPMMGQMGRGRATGEPTEDKLMRSLLPIMFRSLLGKEPKELKKILPEGVKKTGLFGKTTDPDAILEHIFSLLGADEEEDARLESAASGSR